MRGNTGPEGRYTSILSLVPPIRRGETAQV